MFELQGGVCAICKEPETVVEPGCRPRSLAVDHNHITGRIRGLLCLHCNRALGLVEDSPEKIQAMLEYIKLHKGDTFNESK